MWRQEGGIKDLMRAGEFGTHFTLSGGLQGAAFGHLMAVAAGESGSGLPHSTSWRKE